MYPQNELKIVRDLAKEYANIANSEKHLKMLRRFKDNNDLKVGRPPVIIEEIPWHEMNMDGALDCVCTNDMLRGMEYGLRVALFREKYFKCDNYIEHVWSVGKTYSSTGNGLAVHEKTLSVDKRNGIVSHSYDDVLADESSLEAFHAPVITAYPENDKNNIAAVEEIIGGIMPVELRGHGIYWAPWDTISSLRGVEPILMDLYERPEYLHKIIGLFTLGMNAEMDQMEKLGLYDPRGLSLHCTPASVTVPNPSESGTMCCDIWFRTMAQMFSTISPDAHEEFDIQYSRPLAERCAFTYYGCCEPLHDRIDKLKKYKNLRKVGVSPWADINMSAEAIGGNYVFSRKPNPANVANGVDEKIIHDEISETVKVCIKYGCPCDITLKDISTVSYKPQTLIKWSQIVSDVLDEFYGE